MRRPENDIPLSTIALVALAAAGAALFVAMWLLVRGGAVPGIDRDAFTLLASSDGGLIDHVANSRLQPAVEFGVLLTGGAGVALLAVRGRWRAVAVILAGGLCDVVAAHSAKPAIGRPRPPHPLLSADGPTFPSTHAAYSIGLLVVALAVAALVERRLPRIALVATTAAFVVVLGIALIAIRVHYFTDVLGGWGVGVATFALCALAARGLDAVRR